MTAAQLARAADQRQGLDPSDARDKQIAEASNVAASAKQAADSALTKVNDIDGRLEVVAKAAEGAKWQAYAAMGTVAVAGAVTAFFLSTFVAGAIEEARGDIKELLKSVTRLEEQLQRTRDDLEESETERRALEQRVRVLESRPGRNSN